MNRIPVLVAVACAGMWVSPAVAAPAIAARAFANGDMFASGPVSDGDLASSTAGAMADHRARTRLLSDQNSRSFLQQVGQDSRIALDNWWAQTGAALIDANLLARP